MKIAKSLVGFTALTAVLFAACSSVPEPEPEPEREAVAAATEEWSDEAAAPDADYFPEGVVLAGIRLFDWQGDLYTVPFYTAKVVTPASAASKGEAEVEPTGKVADSAETRFRTPYLFESKPAAAEELAVGALVFAMGDATARTRGELAATTRWALFRVKELPNLDKGTVVLEYHDTYWNEWKAGEYHVDNIRLVLGSPSTELVE
ncbi:MAG: hypothetical protein JXA15_08100 [Spirochaetales bacterium]|nr:hypothetical protein [Spirochaetales bacterium]